MQHFIFKKKHIGHRKDECKGMKINILGRKQNSYISITE